MKFFGVACFGIGALLWVASPAQAKFSVSPAEFSQIKAVLCAPVTIEDMKAIGRNCAATDFEFQSLDLNDDGQAEILAYGPAGECGAHGNCPFHIFRKEKAMWVALMPKACNSDACLGWANSYASEVLNSSHQGYRDLNIAADSGSFFWTKSIYEWNGSEYRLKANSTTYFLVDQDSKLKQVNKGQYENCSKNGKGCL